MYTFYQINPENSFEAMNYKYCLPENLKIRNFIGRGKGAFKSRGSILYGHLKFSLRNF